MLPLVLATLFAAPPVGDTTPDVRLAVSRDLVNLLARQPIDRCDAYDETILGTRVRGVVRLTGEVNVELAPSDAGAAFDLVLTGTSNPVGNLVGANGPVVLVTAGESLVAARKRLLVTAEGIATLPALADVVPGTCLKRIDTPFAGRLDQLVRQRAQATFDRDRDRADAEARALASRKVAARFDESIGQRLACWNKLLGCDFREPLQRAGIDPGRLALSSDPAFLHVVGRVAGGPPVAIALPPELPPAPAAFWVHESVPNDRLTRVLGGRRVTGEQTRDALRQVLGGRLPPPPTAPEDAAATVTFAEQGPISVAFVEGRVAVTFRFVAFSRGEDVFDNPNFRLAATVKYAVRHEGGTIALEPVGEVAIERPDGKPPSPRQLQVIKEMRPEIERLLGEKPPALPATFDPPAALARRVGKVRVERVVARDGWLAVSLGVVPPVVE